MPIINNNDNVDRLRGLIINKLRLENRDALRHPAKYKSYLESVAHIVARSSNITSDLDVINAVVNDLLGYGPINPLMSSNTITEVQVTCWDKIYIEENGILKSTSVKFRSERHLRTLAEKIALLSGRRLDESNNYLDTKLPDGTRVNVNIPPLAASGTNISFRRFPHPFTLDELTQLGTLTEEAFLYIKEVIRHNLNIGVTGPMSSGKTTILNALIQLIGKMHGQHVSVVTYEDTVELQPQHENLRQFESQPPNIEGKGGVTLMELAQTQMLRTRADWIILGESRGAEAYYIVAMMCTGHSAITTFHAFDVFDAILFRMPAMIVMSDEGKSEGREGALSRTANAFDVVIHCAKTKIGDKVERRIVQIAEVFRERLSDGVIIPKVQELFTWKNGRLEQVAESQVFQKRREWV